MIRRSRPESGRWPSPGKGGDQPLSLSLAARQLPLPALPRSAQWPAPVRRRSTFRPSRARRGVARGRGCDDPLGRRGSRQPLCRRPGSPPMILAPAARAERRQKPGSGGRRSPMTCRKRIGRGCWRIRQRSCRLLQALADHGFALLHQVPLEPGQVAAVGDRLGHVRVTNYGRLFDVVSIPNPNNLAFTAVGLGVHTDNPYRDPTPGLQLLHCLEAGAPGGDTLLVRRHSCRRRVAPAAPGRLRASGAPPAALPLRRCRSGYWSAHPPCHLHRFRRLSVDRRCISTTATMAALDLPEETSCPGTAPTALRRDVARTGGGAEDAPRAGRSTDHGEQPRASRAHGLRSQAGAGAISRAAMSTRMGGEPETCPRSGASA